MILGTELLAILRTAGFIRVAKPRFECSAGRLHKISEAEGRLRMPRGSRANGDPADDV